ncbi:MAG: hypothetical protein AAF086_07990 [Planctomycetota bacterium]
MEPLPNPCFAVMLLTVTFLLAALFFMPARHAQAQAPDQDRDPAFAEPILEPAPDLSPRQVITAQLVGLKRAADPEAPADQGMRVVWNFAAPANQEITGPFERFDAMVRAEPYGVLVGHKAFEIARLDQDPDRPVAQALVAVTHGQAQQVAWFVWMLSRPAEGEDRAGCWVTDAVYPVEVEDEPADPGQII